MPAAITAAAMVSVSDPRYVIKWFAYYSCAARDDYSSTKFE